MKVLRHLFVVLFIMLLISSCAYYPHLTGVPLINEKGDTRLEGGFKVPSPSGHATVSYGLTDKIAIQGAASIGGGKGAYYVQGAAGLFKNLQNRNVMELYGGFGYGYAYSSGSFSTHGYKPELYGHYQVYFTQFNFGKNNRGVKNTDYGLGLKTGYIHASLTDHNFHDYYSEYGPYSVREYNGILIEPQFFFRVGNEKLKFQTTLGFCHIIKIMNTDKRQPHWPINLGVGISYSL